MDLLRRLVAPAATREASSSALEQIVGSRAGFATYAGVPVNEDSAMRHLTVWACVSLIADAIAMMPLHTFASGTVSNGEVELPTRVPDPTVVDQPHPEMTRSEWHVRMLWSVLVRGNAYGEVVERGARSIPTIIEPIHPDEVRIERDADGLLVYVVGRSRRRVPAFDMIHVRGLVVPGSVYGLSPIDYARQVIGTGLAAIEYGARFFSEGAVPPGILRTEQKLDIDTATDYQNRWEEAHGHRSRKVAVLGGGLDYQAVQLSPEASQFLATQELSRGQIAGFYRVPPHLIGDVDRSTSWGTGIEEQGHQFVTFTLGPWLRRFEDAWKIALGGNLYARYSTAALLRGRLTERYTAYTMARQGGWLNIDEIRALEELGPLEDDKGTDYLQPLNYAPIPPGGGPAEPAPVTPAAP
jgi:HK97 family phage portal protein